MLRRLLIALASVLVVIVVLVVGAVAFRIAIAQTLLKDRLIALGFENAQVQIEALDFERTRLVTLAAGDSDQMQARAVEVSYSLTRLFTGPALEAINEIIVDGMTLHIDLTGGGPPLGNLQSLLEAEEASAEAGRAPPITLHDAQISMTTRFGDFNTVLDGTITPQGIGEVKIDLDVTLRGDLGELSGAFQARATSDGTMNGDLKFEDGKVKLPGLSAGEEGSIQGVGGEVSFNLANWKPVNTVGNLTFAAIGLAGLSFKDAAVSFSATSDTAELSGDLATDDGTFEMKLDGTLSDYRASPKLNLDVTTRASAETAIFEALALSSPSSGQASVEFKAWGSLAPLDEIVDDSSSGETAQSHEEALLSWLRRGQLSASLQAGLQDLTYPDMFSDLAGKLDTEASLNSDGLRIDLTQDADVAVADVDEDWLAGVGLPPEVAKVLAAGGELKLQAGATPPTRVRVWPGGQGHEVELSLAAEAQMNGLLSKQPVRLAGLLQLDLGADLAIATLSGRELSLTASDVTLAEIPLTKLGITGALNGTPDDLQGDATLDASLSRYATSDLTVEGATLQLPVTFRVEGNKVALEAQNSGQVAATEVVFDGTTVTKPAATIAGGTVSISGAKESNSNRPSLVYDLDLKPKTLRASIARDDEAPLGLRAELRDLRLSGTAGGEKAHSGHAVLNGKTVTLDDPAVSLSGITAEADYGDDLSQLTVNFKVTTAQSLADPPFGPAAALEGEVQRNGNAITFAAEARPLDETNQPLALTLPIKGSYDLKSGSGEAKLASTKLAFTPTGLQPRDLFPKLTEIIDVLGDAIVGATVTFGNGPADGTARLAIDDLGFGYGQTPVRGVEMILALNRLVPPASPPSQRLNVGHIESLVPIKNIQASFQLLPSDELAVKIERLSFHMAEGDWWMEETTITPNAQRNTAVLHVDGLDLNRLLTDIDLKGLSGSGDLDGSIPLTLENDDLTITDAKLQSTEPGVLSYRSTALSGGLSVDSSDLELLENPVDLVVLALENFHYDTLAITINKESDGGAQMLLQISGRNPKLLDGYPFNFNVNLAGNVNPLVSALEQGVTLTNEMIQRSWTLSP